jgi:excisionase family DNA binding protein
MEHLIDSKRLTLIEAAQRLGLHPTTISRWCRIGVKDRRLASFKFGGRRVVLLQDLEDFLAAGASDSDSGPPAENQDHEPNQAGPARDSADPKAQA